MAISGNKSYDPRLVVDQLFQHFLFCQMGHWRIGTDRKAYVYLYFKNLHLTQMWNESVPGLFQLHFNFVSKYITIFTEAEKLEFLANSAFYIGKGTNTRVRDHLNEAHRLFLNFDVGCVSTRLYLTKL
jgi:hypothetical protein